MGTYIVPSYALSVMKLDLISDAIYLVIPYWGVCVCPCSMYVCVCIYI